MAKIKGWKLRKDLWKGSNWNSYVFEKDEKIFVNIGQRLFDGKNLWFVSHNNGKRYYKSRKEALKHAVIFMKDFSFRNLG